MVLYPINPGEIKSKVGSGIIWTQDLKSKNKCYKVYFPDTLTILPAHCLNNNNSNNNRNKRVDTLKG